MADEKKTTRRKKAEDAVEPAEAETMAAEEVVAEAQEPVAGGARVTEPMAEEAADVAGEQPAEPVVEIEAEEPAAEVEAGAETTAEADADESDASEEPAPEPEAAVSDEAPAADEPAADEPAEEPA